MTFPLAYNGCKPYSATIYRRKNLQRLFIHRISSWMHFIFVSVRVASSQRQLFSGTSPNTTLPIKAFILHLVYAKNFHLSSPFFMNHRSKIKTRLLFTETSFTSGAGSTSTLFLQYIYILIIRYRC